MPDASSPAGSPAHPDDALDALRVVAPVLRHPVALIEADGRVSLVNDALVAMLADGAPVRADTGAPHADDLARQLADRVPESKRDVFVTDWDAAWNVARRGGQGECRLLDIAPDGAPRWLRFQLSALGTQGHVLVEGSSIESAQIALDTRQYLADGWKRRSKATPPGAATAPADTLAELAAELRAERQERERRALEAEARARALFTTLERISDAFYAVDRDGRLTYVNAHAERLLGVTRRDVTGRTFAELVPTLPATAFGPLHDAATRTGVMQRVEAYAGWLDRWIEWTVYPSETGLTAYLRDVTEERALRARTIAAQRTEAMALLAGSIAHDFNNLLTALFGGLQLVRLDLDEAHPSQADLAEAEQTVQRAAHLARQLLTFSRRQEQPSQLVDVTAVVRDLQPLLRRLAGERIVLGTDLAEGVPPVRMDPGLLEQALIDLIAHARATMDGGTGVEVRVAAERPSSAMSLSSGVLPAGTYVRVDVHEGGHALGPEAIARLFRPGTGTDGDGEGLGMLAVRSIMRQSGGAVHVDSASGRGTVFSLFLPADLSDATSEPAASVRDAAPSAASGAGEGRGEHVLLVEDEAGVRAISALLLTRHGYRVTEARHGADGIAAWRRLRDDIAIVVSDMRMPEMNGRQLLAALRAEGASCPVLFISGYPLEVLGPDEHPDEGEILAKPFEGRDLLRRVRALLDMRGAALAAAVRGGRD